MKFPTVLRIFVFGLPFLVVTFAVLMGGAALTRGLGDSLATRIMTGIAAGVAVAIFVDLILLVGMLGLQATWQMDRNEARWQRIRQWKKRKGRGRRGGRRRGRHRHEDHDHGDHGDHEHFD